MALRTVPLIVEGAGWAREKSCDRKGTAAFKWYRAGCHLPVGFSSLSLEPVIQLGSGQVPSAVRAKACHPRTPHFPAFS